MTFAADPETLLVPLTNRKVIADSIERLIDMLDAMSPDPDLEDGADDEPWLGWGPTGAPGETFDLERDEADDEPALGAPENHPTPRSWPYAKPTRGKDGAQSGWYADTMVWGEDEPTMGSLSGDQTRWATGQDVDEAEEENEHGGDVLDEPHDDLDQGDREPWLGWGNTMGQPGIGGAKDMVGVEDNPDDGCSGFTGEGKDMARQMLRTGRARRPEPSLTIVGPVVTVPGWKGPLSQADADSMDARAHYWAAKGF